MRVIIDYTNWRGVRAERTVEPLRWEFMKTAWHPEIQWIMTAVDEDGKVKGFAMSGIHSWRAA